MTTINLKTLTQRPERTGATVARVRPSPNLGHHEAAWVHKVLTAIQSDRAPLMGRLLKEADDIFGNLCEMSIASRPDDEPKRMNFLELALACSSYACTEFLSKRWHDAGLYSEVEEAASPLLMIYEAHASEPSNIVFEKPIAALARGLFRSQALSEDYGLAPFSVGYPLAVRATTRIFFEQTPAPGPASKLFQKRAFWLRRAARFIADEDVAELAGCLANLHALPIALPKGCEFMELHLLMMACVAMKRLSCSRLIFDRLAQMRDLSLALGFQRYFLAQIESHLGLAGESLDGSEEDVLATGMASVALSLAGSAEGAAAVGAFIAAGVDANFGAVSAVMEKAALQVEAQMQRGALDACVPPSHTQRRAAVAL